MSERSDSDVVVSRSFVTQGQDTGHKVQDIITAVSGYGRESKAGIANFINEIDQYNLSHTQTQIIQLVIQLNKKANDDVEVTSIHFLPLNYENVPPQKDTESLAKNLTTTIPEYFKRYGRALQIVDLDGSVQCKWKCKTYTGQA